MNNTVLTKIYGEPPFSEKEILRYSGCSEADSRTVSLIESCITEVRDTLTYSVCYREFPLSLNDGVCDFGDMKIISHDLAKNLDGCESAVIFAATVGVKIDRLIAKYSRISPSRAIILQAIGAERIEALCDAFCDDIKREYSAHTKPRFSPGYGDLPLSSQGDIFGLLHPEKHIGLTLNDSLLMSPSKSVTAIIGLGGKI